MRTALIDHTRQLHTILIHRRQYTRELLVDVVLKSLIARIDRVLLHCVQQRVIFHVTVRLEILRVFLSA